MMAFLVPLEAVALEGREVQALVEQALADAGQGGQAMLSANRGFPSCPMPPEVSPHRGGWQAVSLRCEGPGGWTRVIRIEGGQAAARLPGGSSEVAQRTALMLTESLPRGTVLQAEHLRVAGIAANAQGDLVESMQTALGRRLKSNLGAGQPLLARHLEYEWLVDPDGPVTIVTAVGGIRIEASGIALEPGQLGQDIRVTNATSGQVVHVTVTGRNKVTVRPNIR
ncbi:flagellar basal body P-ring formation chaperone FlgA [Roseovarius sp.]|uniref:flagellar basal body P-ring formation chaperone FlgA n=1 Tax=Roseovarius sp. TaxID=1486281 RepID=UPI003A981110